MLTLFELDPKTDPVRARLRSIMNLLQGEHFNRKFGFCWQSVWDGSWFWLMLQMSFQFVMLRSASDPFWGRSWSCVSHLCFHATQHNERKKSTPLRMKELCFHVALWLFFTFTAVLMHKFVRIFIFLQSFPFSTFQSSHCTTRPFSCCLDTSNFHGAKLDSYLCTPFSSDALELCKAIPHPA